MANSWLNAHQAAINRYLDEAKHDPKPFIWTADPDKIIAAVDRAPSVRVDPLGVRPGSGGLFGE
jgi:hypothetical protein